MESGERFVRVTVQARTFRCEASVIVPAGGYRGRVIDLLNTDTQFLALTDVRLFHGGEGAEEDPVRHDVLLLRKGEIEFVIPLDDHW
ncbi:MAG: hypothetical protein H6Q86_5086 [candidate division NC10 bacterium]|nr:hypothetical protein [candidate division NC10 bacterium]